MQAAQNFYCRFTGTVDCATYDNMKTQCSRVQSSQGPGFSITLGVMAGPLFDDVGTTSYTVDVSDRDAAFFEQVAQYRNAIALAKDGKPLRRKWTRKTITESVISGGADSLRKQFAEMVAALGEMPDGADEPGMLRYAKRVLTWFAKHGE